MITETSDRRRSRQEMVDYLVMCRSKGHSVQVVAFPGGDGTANMIERAERAGIDVDRF